jgi:endoglucanase
VSLLAQLTDNGRLLPPDWARLSNDQLVAIPNPGGSAPVQYGLDAARLPMWLGTGCTTAQRQLAARWWSAILSRDNRAAAIALSPSGAAINQETNPLPLLAGAAAARAAGDTTAARTLRTRAAQQSHQTPTYYGDAWLALGGALLDRTLDPCGEASSG